MEIEVVSCKLSDREGNKKAFGKIKLLGCLTIIYDLMDGRTGLWTKLGMSKKLDSGKYFNGVYLEKSKLSFEIHDAVMKEYDKLIGGTANAGKEVWPDEVVVDKGTHFTAEDIPFNKVQDCEIL
jgi:DNA-binding cell septation regulator SpoVG